MSSNQGAAVKRYCMQTTSDIHGGAVLIGGPPDGEYVRASDFDSLATELVQLKARCEAVEGDAERRIELARNEGFREGWMRCGTYHVDCCFETPDEHAEVDRRLAALSCPRCHGSRLVTLSNYDGNGSDADDQPCPECK